MSRASVVAVQLASPSLSQAPLASPEPSTPSNNTGNGIISVKTKADVNQILASTNLETGLTSAQVVDLIAIHGRNESVERLTHPLLVFLLKFTGLSSFLLEAVIVIAIGLANYVDAAVVGALLLTNAILGWVQDMRARAAIRELKQKMQLQARACRDGKWSTIPAAETVPGDVIRLRFGDSVPADCIIVAGDCDIDQSALMGESELKFKSLRDTIYGGSMLKGGECTAVITATGAATYFGQTMQLVQNSKPNAHVNRIVRNVSVALLVAVIIMLVIALIVTAIRGQDLVNIVTLILVLLVSAIPVALPAMFTVSMAVGSKELVKHHVLVTRLNATEDCASMTVLCSDKTGTLTKNELTVQNLWLNPFTASLSCVPEDLIRCAALCSRVENHDPIDQAVLRADNEMNPTKQRLPIYGTASPSLDLIKALPTVVDSSGELALSPLASLLKSSNVHFQLESFVPFDATTRRTEACFTVSLHSEAPSTFRLRVCKGAANTLLALCQCTETETQTIYQQIDHNATRGYRSMAVAASLSAISSALVPDAQFQFLGVFSLHDPVREDSAAVIKKLHELGVQTKMLTGDAKAVAVETARILGMGTNFVNIHSEPISHHGSSPPSSMCPRPNDNAVSSDSASSFNYEWLTADGFAEVYPSDKHQIVSALQKGGHIVGMTGDGVNDSPSLKQAEVGVAMSNATDVAKSAASAVLLDEGLAGVLVLIRVGRSIHRRIVTWIINKIAKTLQTVLFVVVSFLITGQFPITAFGMVLLLFLIDFVTISLATDRVRVSPKPDRWDVLQLTRIATVVGILSAAQAIGFVMLSTYQWKMTSNEINTLSFELLYFFGICTTFLVREDRFFWSSLPSPLLIGVCVVEAVIVVAICSVGVPQLTAISFSQAIIVPFYAAGCSFILNDLAKVIYYKWIQRASSPLMNIATGICTSQTTTNDDKV